MIILFSSISDSCAVSEMLKLLHDKIRLMNASVYLNEHSEFIKGEKELLGEMKDHNKLVVFGHYYDKGYSNLIVENNKELIFNWSHFSLRPSYRHFGHICFGSKLYKDVGLSNYLSYNNEITLFFSIPETNVRIQNLYLTILDIVNLFSTISEIEMEVKSAYEKEMVYLTLNKGIGYQALLTFLFEAYQRLSQ